MIVKLQSKDVRTVYSRKVVRLTVDVPFHVMQEGTIDGRDALEYLDVNVGNSIGITITALTDQNQSEVNENE